MCLLGMLCPYRRHAHGPFGPPKWPLLSAILPLRSKDYPTTLGLLAFIFPLFDELSCALALRRYASETWFGGFNIVVLYLCFSRVV